MERGSMRIAIFTDCFLPQIDGVATATLNLTKGLANRGHKVYIIAPKYRGVKEFKHKNIKVIRINAVPALFYPQLKISNPFSMSLYLKLKKEKIDLIHFQTPLTIGMQGIVLSRMLKVPLVGTFHTMIADLQYLKHGGINVKLAQNLTWKYARAYYNRCNLITCPSESTKKELLDNDFTKPIKVISNGINFSIFDNSKWKKVRNKYNPGGKLLLFVGRLAYEKNIPYLLECFKLVLHKSPNTKLLIIGDGPQVAEIKSFSERLELKNNIIFTGRINHEELIKSSIFKACDLFVTASTTENQPMTILEAQANGLVCICLNKRGVKDLIKSGYNGYLAKSKKEFSNRIIELLSDNKLRSRMRKNTLREIRKHDIKKVITIWERTYSKLIKDF